MSRYHDIAKHIAVMSMKWWYSPSGEIFYVPEPLTHERWISDNKDMLQDDYGIKLDILGDMYRELVGLGWTRIVSNAHGVNADVLENRIGDLENFLIQKFPQLWKEGSDVVVIINNTELPATLVQEHSSLVEAYHAGKRVDWFALPRPTLRGPSASCRPRCPSFSRPAPAAPRSRRPSLSA